MRSLFYDIIYFRKPRFISSYASKPNISHFLAVFRKVDKGNCFFSTFATSNYQPNTAYFQGYLIHKKPKVMLKFLLIFILLLAFVPALRRFLFWLVVGRQLVKEQKKHQKSTQTPPKREGDVRVDFIPKEDQKPKFRGGQYVDYEEVKE